MNNKHVKISNFGIIKNAEIDLNSLNVFIGANSSGKSFIARLIHCFNSRDLDNFDDELFMFLQNSLNNLDESNVNLVNDIKEKLFDYIKSQPKINSNPFKISLEEFNPLMDKLILDYYSKILKQKIQEQFDIPLSQLINFNENSFKIAIGNYELKNIDDNLNFKIVDFPFKTDETGEDEENSGKIALKFNRDEKNLLIFIESILFNLNEKEDIDSLFLVIVGLIANYIFKDIFLEDSYYLIAERSDLVTDKKALTRRIQDISYFSKNQIDILSEIYNIDSTKKGEFYRLGCEFDEEFSGLMVDIKNNEIFNDISYTDIKTGREIHTNLLSTSIHEMALLSLYLKYIVKKGDLLIIEEPEAHLHPKNQRILTKFIVRAINKGLKIMITTHSDYVVEQFNNLIRLSTIDKNLLDEFNYTVDDILNPENISMYHFKKEENYLFTAQKVDINETGFYEESLTPISEELYDESDKIIDLMHV